MSYESKKYQNVGPLPPTSPKSVTLEKHVFEHFSSSTFIIINVNNTKKTHFFTTIKKHSKNSLFSTLPENTQKTLKMAKNTRFSEFSTF